MKKTLFITIIPPIHINSEEGDDNGHAEHCPLYQAGGSGNSHSGSKPRFVSHEVWSRNYENNFPDSKFNSGQKPN